MLRESSLLGLFTMALLCAACSGDGDETAPAAGWDGSCLCPDPPETDWHSQCASGSTFQAYLVGACGGSAAISDSPTADVTAIRIERHGHAILVELETPQHVKLSPELWQIDYQIEAVARAVLIDLLAGAAGPVPFPSTSLRYTIRPE